MDEMVTIDRAGRLVIPIRLRRRLHLVPGSRLRVREQGARLILEAIPEEPRVEEKDGLLVVRGTIGDASVDHRTVREEHLEGLTPQP